MFNLTVSLNINTYLNANVQKLINDPKEEFDLVIVEWIFTELYCGYV
jgi:hypothetical protein